MAKSRLLPTINVDGYFTAKVKGAIADTDVGKPVRLATDVPDTYQLAADGETIEGFIDAVAAATSDGLYLCTINPQGRVRCEADGALTIGGFVEAAANAAAGAANTNGLPLVSDRAAAVAGVATWRVISGITEDGDVADGDTYVVIERVI